MQYFYLGTKKSIIGLSKYMYGLILYGIYTRDKIQAVF